MHPLAHHAGEDTLAPLLLLGGAWLSVLAAYSRERLTSIRARLARKQAPPAEVENPGQAPRHSDQGHRQREGHRTLCVNRSDPPRPHLRCSAGPRAAGRW
jgi:hypothetical protein